jgi:hypothetical protein
MDEIKIFKEYLARVIESANRQHELHQEQLGKSIRKLNEMFKELKTDLDICNEDLAREKDRSYFLNEKVKKYEKALNAYGDKEGKIILKALERQ